jgi:S1-C subfamily serine protease
MATVQSRVALAIVFCLAEQAASAIAVRGDDSQPSTRARTFVVQAMLEGGKAAIGSGVVVARSGDVLTLATAAHIVWAGSPLRILDTTRRAFYDVLDVRLLPAYDLALVRVKAQKDSPPDAALFSRAVAGEPVWMWGNPDRSFWRLATGTVQAVNARLPDEAGAPRITISCDRCTMGDSGAGVFDSSGRLVGILTTMWGKPDGPAQFFEVQPIAIVQQQLEFESGVNAASAPQPP